MKRRIKMKLLGAAILVFVLIQFSQGQENRKFKSLFNGQNLDGWYAKIRSADAELAKKVYVVEDGMIHVFRDLPDSTGFCKGENSTHGLIYTNKKFSKFIFRFEYKWGKKIYNNFDQFQYDAGMYYHVVDDKIWPEGIEYQVRYDHTKNQNHTGDFWASQIQWYSKDSLTFTIPSEGGKPMPLKNGEHRATMDAKFNALNDQWNKCEIIVMGNQYAIHKLNGKIVNMATNLPFSEGAIGLQSETAEIYYRNIEVKEFYEAIPIEYFLK